MPRDASAYLADIVESCDAIAVAVRDLDLVRYQGSRLVRSSVEREFVRASSPQTMRAGNGMRRTPFRAARDLPLPRLNRGGVPGLAGPSRKPGKSLDRGLSAQ